MDLIKAYMQAGPGGVKHYFLLVLKIVVNTLSAEVRELLEKLAGSRCSE